MLLAKKLLKGQEQIEKIRTYQTALSYLATKVDRANAKKLSKIKNQDVVIKIAEIALLTRPKNIFFNTGSAEDLNYIKKLSLKLGEEKKLARAGHTIHFDLPEDQGRIAGGTYVLAEEDEGVSSKAKRLPRLEGTAQINRELDGIMKNKTMIVGLYLRGPKGSPVSNPVLNITDSAYVYHTLNILYRIDEEIFSNFDQYIKNFNGLFYTNIHSKGIGTSEAFKTKAGVYRDPVALTTYSVENTYVGNSGQIKKGNHNLTIYYFVNKHFGEKLSEHMFITGIKGTNNRITYIAGAAPSGCGKTTTAMTGEHFIGDDLAQMWIKNGEIKTINPERGIFAIVKDVNPTDDPPVNNVLRKTGKEVIYSNTLADKNGLPRWLGDGLEMPQKGINHNGAWQSENNTDFAAENARATFSATELPNYTQEAENANGVKVDIVTYAGRDPDTMPPIRVARNVNEGVVIGATIVSQKTAQVVGGDQTGAKWDPFANTDFVSCELSAYLDHVLAFFNNNKIEDRPLMVGLNYFLTENSRGNNLDKDRLLGEKRDVHVWLSWAERRKHGEVSIIESPIGFLPVYEDLRKLFKEILNKDYSYDLYEKQFSLYVDNIIARIDLNIDNYTKENLNSKTQVPYQLFDVLNKQKEELLALKKEYGNIIRPADLRIKP